MAPLLENIRFEALKKLAAERFGPITPPEEEVLRLSASTEMAYPDELQERPEISAAFLRWLAIDSEAAAHIDPLGLRVNNCIIPSTLDLTGSKLPFRLHLQNCNFQSAVYLLSAVLPELIFYNCVTEHGIVADGLDSRGDVFLKKLRSAGEIRIPGAQIGGDLDCSDASLTTEGRALNADRVNISGGVFLREGFSSKGEVRFLGAQIGGTLDCSGASLTSEGNALSAERANISGNVFFRDGFTSKGNLRFHDAQIGGNLDCSQATMQGLFCEFMRLNGNFIWRALVEPDQSYLNLFGATIGTLSDDTASWVSPGRLVIKGCEYKNLTHHESSTEEHLEVARMAPQRQLEAKERIQWLMLQDDEDRPDPHAWMWLATLFKEKDDIAGYRRIICEYRCLKARVSKNPARRTLGILLAEIERNPWRMFWAFLPLLLLGTAIFWAAAHHIPPTNSDASRAWVSGAAYPAAYPRFNPLIYTLENELPLIKFGMDDKWAPDPNLSTQDRASLYWFLVGFRWFLIAAGWIQGILLTVGINRRFRD